MIGGAKARSDMMGGVKGRRGGEGTVEEVSRAPGRPRGEDAADDLGDEEGVGCGDRGSVGNGAGAASCVVGAWVGGQDGCAAAVADGGVGLEKGVAFVAR